MPKPVTTIRNLGPAMADACARAGINSAEELYALGTDAAYARLITAGERPHFIVYYALEMGLQGRPWSDCTPDEKRTLRTRFDALKARSHDKGRSELETALDKIGVVPRKRSSYPTNSNPEKK